MRNTPQHHDRFYHCCNRDHFDLSAIIPLPLPRCITYKLAAAPTCASRHKTMIGQRGLYLEMSFADAPQVVSVMINLASCTVDASTTDLTSREVGSGSPIKSMWR